MANRSPILGVFAVHVVSLITVPATDSCSLCDAPLDPNNPSSPPLHLWPNCGAFSFQSMPDVLQVTF